MTRFFKKSGGVPSHSSDIQHFQEKQRNEYPG